jgi:flagellar biosynthesis protein FlhF
MSRRLKAPQRRARRVARLGRDSEPAFDLLAVAARSNEPDTPVRRWPGGDLAFLKAVLETHHVPAALTKRLLAAAASLPVGARLLDRLSAALADQIHFAPLDEMLRAPVLLLVGPPGAGKTTLAAKLAAQLGERGALLVGADTARAGGTEQLEEYAQVLGLEVALADNAEALTRALASAAGRRAVVDTTGLAPGDELARDHLAALLAASGAEPVLVLPADSAAEEATAMVRFVAPLRATTLVPTRLDLVHRLGGVLAAADTGRFALRVGGMTPHFAYGLHSLTPSAMASRLLTTALEDERSRLPAA